MMTQYWMPMLSLAFFLVAMLNVYEMTKLTINYEHFVEEKLQMERTMATIFLCFSIIISVVSYGHRAIYILIFSTPLIIAWFFAPYVYEIANKLIFILLGIFVGYFMGIAAKEWTKL